VPARTVRILVIIVVALVAAVGVTLITYYLADEEPAVPPTLEQPAIWPAADVVFATPEEAARDFVSKVLGVEPVLGEFRQGDARSGEIEVLFLGEGGDARFVRSLLLLRQLGPDNGWFILAAVNDNITIASPESMSTVPAGPLAVAGQGRGFERTVVVTAFYPGAPRPLVEPLAQQITMAGDINPEPFSVTLDLAAATPGAVVTLLVRGDTGATGDPGEFSAIPVVIAP
jgi:catechol 2,3-dioxygenase-like lactoylglutathione lyase family enzyme